jgi:hypothetical protein
MQGADSDNLKSFIADATAFRNVELAKGKPVNVIGLTMTFADGKTASLQWSTSTIDMNGNPLPPDWIVIVTQ